MDDWDFEKDWWYESLDDDDLLQEWTGLFADHFFLSDYGYLPSEEDDYRLGFLDAEDWWPLVNQLEDLMDLEELVGQFAPLDLLLRLDGLPTALLEDPLGFLQVVLEGNLPPESSGRRVGSRRLVKIAQVVIQLTQVLPETARAAVRAWANVHRQQIGYYPSPDLGQEYLSDLLLSPDLPPAMTGFSMVIAMTLIKWPQRAEGLPMPPGFAEPGFFERVLHQWLELPDSPRVTEEGVGEAEALFAQGQLAHMLAQMGSVELMSPDELEEQDMSLAYSRLSRSILWIHDQCRHCPEREGVTCKVATNWEDGLAPLLDVAGEIANTGRIGGCIKM